MIPDWSERSADGVAYPYRHWSAVEQEYCTECDEPLSQDELEFNNGICNKCFGRIQENLEDDR